MHKDSELVTLTRDNIKDVARRSGRPEQALLRGLIQAETRNQRVLIEVRKKE